MRWREQLVGAVIRRLREWALESTVSSARKAALRAGVAAYE